MFWDVEILNNREKAITVWLVILLICILSKKKVRQGFGGVIKALFQKKIFTAIMTMLLYNAIIIYFFYKIHIWKYAFIKDSIFWIIGSAFVLFLNIPDNSKKKNYLKKIVIDNLKLIIVLEFILNFYTFNFWIEIVLVPIISLILLMLAVSETNKEFSQITKFLNNLSGLIGIILMSYAIIRVLKDHHSLINMDNARAIILTPLLTIAYIPFLYLFSLIMGYEMLFCRLNIFLSNDIARLIKIEIIKLCHINLRKLNSLSTKIIPPPTLTDANAIRKYFKNINEKNRE